MDESSPSTHYIFYRFERKNQAKKRKWSEIFSSQENENDIFGLLCRKSFPVGKTKPYNMCDLYKTNIIPLFSIRGFLEKQKEFVLRIIPIDRYISPAGTGRIAVYYR